MSHTVSIDVKVKNREAAIKAAEGMGATIKGEGTHRLFSTSHTGFAIQFPKWNYPIVIDAEGTVHYDNYNGHWGDQADVDRLVSDYAQAVVELECDNLGWYHEKMDTGEIAVHHPSGGVIIVKKGGQLDAQGFHGVSCSEATLPLEQAMGMRLGETLKPEMNEVQLNQQELAS